MSLFDPVGAATINNSVLSNDTTTTTATNSSSASGFNNPSTRPREDYVATVRSCNNIAGGTASNRRIQEGIAYLGTVSGTPVEGPGPGACGRVSCSYGGAIYWCNDVSFLASLSLSLTQTYYKQTKRQWRMKANFSSKPQNLETKVLSSFSAIGDGAQLLVDHCSYAYERGVNGQQFYDDGWNVIVKYESC